MKNYKNLFAAALLGGAMLTVSSCADDFADTNTKKDAITTGTPEYLLGQAILEFDPSSYTYWFFNSVNFAYAVQTAVPSGSATETIIEGSSQQGYKNIAVQNYLYMIKHELAQMAPEDAARYQQVEAIVKVLCTYLGIYDVVNTQVSTQHLYDSFYLLVSSGIFRCHLSQLMLDHVQVVLNSDILVTLL